jgi:hypothetical protein
LLKVLTSHPNQEKFFFLNNILTWTLKINMKQIHAFLLFVCSHFQFLVKLVPTELNTEPCLWGIHFMIHFKLTFLSWENKMGLHNHNILCEYLCVSVFLSFKLLNHLTDWRTIWPEIYAIKGQTKLLRFNFLQLVTTTWRMHEVAGGSNT